MATQVNANPTKEFFISMLTRDIDIRAAIMELIDNSIDGAKKLRKNGDYSGLYIRIEYDESNFKISDNCGGIGIQTAKDYAFRFGRSSKRPQTEVGQFTGVFGIGMKRSLFRLGNNFQIFSATKNDSFELNVDVKEWLTDENTNWTFNLENEQIDLNNDEESTGTTITITNLHDGIVNQFKTKHFYHSLLLYVERFKTLAIETGLEISINGTPVVFSSEKIIKSASVVPYSNSFTVDDVTVKIVAGIAPKGKPENAGWYIYCNGRLIVYADKTNLTGWGEDGVKNYHPSLAFFRGFLFFESDNLDKLPWNTTKTNVDASSSQYIYAKMKMREAMLQIIEDCHPITEGAVSDEVEKEILSDKYLFPINTHNIEALISSSTVFTLNVPELKKIERTAGISFQKPVKEIEIMKKHMGAKNNKEVGIIAFDYYFKKECDADG